MNKQIMITLGLSNSLEWFDFGLFLYLAPIIGQQFFPTHNPHNATIAAFAVFAVGFICRPLGGILFGYLGDHDGRTKGLRWSVGLIALATLLIGLLPNYQAIGILAPVLFTLLRLLQGLSVGGEYSGVMIYLAESSPSRQRGFFTSFAAVGANFGFLMATLCALGLTLFPTLENIVWLWRIPFVAAGLMGLGIFCYRLQLRETPVYLTLKNNQQLTQQPFIAAMRDFPKKIIQNFALTAMGSTFYYVFFGYFSHYLSQKLGFSTTQSFSLQALLLTVMLFLVPLAGHCGDKFGRKEILCITAVSMLLFAITCFYWITTKSSLAIMATLSVAALLSAAEQGNTLLTLVENCPTSVRYTGVSFAFNLGNALFGGTAPLIIGLLIQHFSNMACAYYLMAMVMISLTAILSLHPVRKPTHDENTSSQNLFKIFLN